MWVSSTWLIVVEDCEVLRFLSSLHARRLVCHVLMPAGRNKGLYYNTVNSMTLMYVSIPCVPCFLWEMQRVPGKYCS